MATYQSNDDSVVVVIGSGAGGGTLANELCQKGIKVVLLEAGKRESPESFVNDEWGSFGQLAWLDKRTTSGSWQVAKDFSGLPAWICKTVGGSTTHWAGASLRFQEHEFRIRSVYGPMKGVNMLDWPLTLKELEPYYTRAEDKLGVTRTHGIPGLPGNNNFKVFYNGATKVGYKDCHTGRMAINSQPRHGRGACQQLGCCSCRSRTSSPTASRIRPARSGATTSATPPGRCTRPSISRYACGAARPWRASSRTKRATIPSAASSVVTSWRRLRSACRSSSPSLSRARGAASSPRPSTTTPTWPGCGS